MNLLLTLILKKYYNILKDLFKDIKTLLILVLIVIILFQSKCSTPYFSNFFSKITPPPTEGSIITKIEVKWDTLKVDSLVYIPKWNIKIDTIHDTTFLDIDTLGVLKDYYTKYFYSDIINLDTLGNITINDTISKNKITSRKILPFLTLPTTTITRDSLINKREFYYGVGLTGNKTQFNYIGGELLYRAKNKRIYGMGLGINQNFQPLISGKLYWKFGR